MKRIIITLLISLAGTLSTYAQCEENAVLSTSKTNLADPSGEPIGVKDERTLLRFSKTAILLNINDEDRGELKIVSQNCNWTIPYKEGRTVIKAKLNDSDYTLTIEGKEGRVSLHVVKNESDDSILSMVVDKFEKIE
jgi:methyl coenzyme M reductase subunit D